MRGLQSDLAAMKEKNSLISQTKAELESRVDELTNEMDNVNSNLMNSSRNAETFNTQVSDSLDTDDLGLMITLLECPVENTKKLESVGGRRAKVG